MWLEVKCLLIYSIPSNQTNTLWCLLYPVFLSFFSPRTNLPIDNELASSSCTLFSLFSFPICRSTGEETSWRYLFSKTYVFFMIDRLNDLMIALFFHWEHVQNFLQEKIYRTFFLANTKYLFVHLYVSQSFTFCTFLLLNYLHKFVENSLCFSVQLILNIYFSDVPRFCCCCS